MPAYSASHATMQEEQGTYYTSPQMLPSSCLHGTYRYLPYLQCPSRARTTIVPSMQVLWDHQVHAPGLVSSPRIRWRATELTLSIA